MFALICERYLSSLAKKTYSICFVIFVLSPCFFNAFRSFSLLVLSLRSLVVPRGPCVVPCRPLGRSCGPLWLLVAPLSPPSGLLVASWCPFVVRICPPQKKNASRLCCFYWFANMRFPFFLEYQELSATRPPPKKKRVVCAVFTDSQT